MTTQHPTMTDADTGPIIVPHAGPASPVGPAFTEQPTLIVPALRGRMGSTVFYSVTLPLGLVPKLFGATQAGDVALPLTERHQRALDPKRVPQIARYITEHSEDYFFASITATVDSPTHTLRFEPLSQDEHGRDEGPVGRLHLPLEADWSINDGQHRVAGIARAVHEDPSLRTDTLSVLILPYQDLQRSQQIFSDLNFYAEKTSRSLDILFDQRVPINRIANRVADEVTLFMGRTDKERPNVTARSANFITLSLIQNATQALVGDVATYSDAVADGAIYFWEAVAENTQPLQRIAAGVLSPQEARENWLTAYGLFFTSVAAAARPLVREHPDDWEARLAAILQAVDWRKSNPVWQSIGVMRDADVITRSTSRTALTRWLEAQFNELGE